MEIQTFKEITNFLVDHGYVENLKNLAVKLNRNYSNLSQVNGGSLPLTKQMVKLINDTFKTEFVYIKKEDPETFGYEECKKMVALLVNQNLELTNKLLQLIEKSNQ